MNGSWLYSLRFRVSLAAVLVLIILFGGAIYNTHRLLSQFARQNTEAIILQTSEILNLAITPKTTEKELPELNDYLNMMVQGDGQALIYLTLRDEHGQILAQTPGTPEPLPKLESDLEVALSQGMMHIKQPILLADNQVGQLYFGFSLKQIARARKDILNNNILLLIGGLLFSMTGIAVIGKSIGKQLQSLVSASQALAMGKHNVRAFDAGKNELCHLANNFNRMADAIAKRTAELQRSQTKLHAMFDGAQDGIILADIQSKKFVDANPAICRMLGYSRTELMTLGVYDIHPISELPQIIDAFEELARSERNIAENTPVLRKNGQVFFADISVALTPIDGRQLLAGFFRDVTERKQSEARLLASQEKFQRLVDDIGDKFVIFSQTVNGELLYVSDGMAAVFGISKDNALHRNWTTLINWTPDTIEQGMQRVADMATGKTNYVHLEMSFFHPSGEIRSIQITAHPVKNQLNHVTNIDGIAEDITERKKLDKELAQHRQQLEQLVATRTEELNVAYQRLEETQFAMDRVGIGIMKINADTGQFLYANDFLIHMLGYNHGELLTLGLSDIDIHYPSEDFRESSRLARELGCTTFTTEQRHKDGHLIPVSVMSYYHSAGNYFIAFVTDITEQKAAEQIIIKAKSEAEAASQAKGAFLANMSHELRTPMNAILGMTNLALRGATDPNQIDKLNKIEQASKHLLQIINDILDISKIEANRLALERTEFTFNLVEQNLDTLLSTKAKEKGLNLIFDIPEDIRRYIFLGDHLRLDQILINLVSNAIKFTDNGTITICVRLIEDKTGEVLLRFEVHDTGIGISDEDKTRLFTAFEQADSSMTRKYGGTGLGLAISKRLVQLMDGEIGCDSTLGQGSCFWFTARFGKASKTASPQRPLTLSSKDDAEAQLKADYPGSRILLAEDDPFNQEVSLTLLETVGLAVDVADDGAQALELAKQNPYKLILMDMQMPNMNGIEATRAIRADSQNTDTPILALTANAFAEDRLACIESGMNDHLPKPTPAKVLYETLLEWLNKSKEDSSAPSDHKHS